jgi:hypothetical protein
MLASICSSRFATLATVKFRSRELTALNLLPMVLKSGARQPVSHIASTSGADRSQGTMFPAQLEDYVAEDNPVRVIGFFVDQLDLRELGFRAVDPKETGRPAYHPAVADSQAESASRKGLFTRPRPSAEIQDIS